MNRIRIRTLIKGITSGLLVAFLALAPSLFAHGGFDHVIGTVAKLSGQVLTVRTDKGDVDVKVNDKTEITKASGKAVAADLTIGARVIVDIPEKSKDKIAHSVKIGVTAPVHNTHN